MLENVICMVAINSSSVILVREIEQTYFALTYNFDKSKKSTETLIDLNIATTWDCSGISSMDKYMTL